jgi:hypothetical protein
LAERVISALLIAALKKQSTAPSPILKDWHGNSGFADITRDCFAS